MPGSVACTANYRALESAGIEYEVIDLSHDVVAQELVKRLGYQHAPVVVTPWEHWWGLRADKIDQLVAVLRCQREVEAAKSALEEAIFELQGRQPQATAPPSE